MYPEIVAELIDGHHFFDHVIFPPERNCHGPEDVNGASPYLGEMKALRHLLQALGAKRPFLFDR